MLKQKINPQYSPSKSSIPPPFKAGSAQVSPSSYQTIENPYDKQKLPDQQSPAIRNLSSFNVEPSYDLNLRQLNPSLPQQDNLHNPKKSKKAVAIVRPQQNPHLNQTQLTMQYPEVEKQGLQQVISQQHYQLHDTISEEIVGEKFQQPAPKVPPKAPKRALVEFFKNYRIIFFQITFFKKIFLSAVPPVKKRHPTKFKKQKSSELEELSPPEFSDESSDSMPENRKITPPRIATAPIRKISVITPPKIPNSSSNRFQTEEGTQKTPPAPKTPVSNKSQQQVMEEELERFDKIEKLVKAKNSNDYSPIEKADSPRTAQKNQQAKELEEKIRLKKNAQAEIQEKIKKLEETRLAHQKLSQNAVYSPSHHHQTLSQQIASSPMAGGSANHHVREVVKQQFNATVKRRSSGNSIDGKEAEKRQRLTSKELPPLPTDHVNQAIANSQQLSEKLNNQIFQHSQVQQNIERIKNPQHSGSTTTMHSHIPNINQNNVPSTKNSNIAELNLSQYSKLINSQQLQQAQQLAALQQLGSNNLYQQPNMNIQFQQNLLGQSMQHHQQSHMNPASSMISPQSYGINVTQHSHHQKHQQNQQHNLNQQLLELQQRQLQLHQQNLFPNNQDYLSMLQQNLFFNNLNKHKK